MVTRAALLCVLAAAAAFAPIPPSVVERLYSSGFYGVLQPVVTTVSNAAPFSLLDVLIVCVAAGWIVLAIRDVAGRGAVRGLGGIAVRTIAFGAAIYLVFLALWGFNYRRVPLSEKLRLDESLVTADGARSIAAAAVTRLNALHDGAHAAGWPDRDEAPDALRGAFAAAEREVGLRHSAVPGRPKRTVLDVYFRRAGVEGMTDPFLLETLVATDLLPFERPFVIAHEWAHLAGFADESEANFVGVLACLNGPPAIDYSAWLFLLGQIAAPFSPAERRATLEALDDGPSRDLAAIRERVAREVSPRVAAAGWRVYDRYLKANRVEAGVESYALVVKLLLGTELGRSATAQHR